MNRRFSQIFSFVLSLIFLSNHSIQAQQTFSFSSPRWVEQINLSSTVGLIREKSSFDSPHLILMPDSHANVAAQKKMVAILNELESKSTKPLLIALEGVQGPVSPVLLKSIPNQADRQIIADHALKQAHLTAGEYFSLFSKKQTLIYGVDSPQLYQQNRRAFLEVQQTFKKVLPRFEQLREALQRQGSQVFSSPLQQWLLKKESYQKGTLSFLDYASLMTGYYQYSLKKELPSLLKAALTVQRQSQLVYSQKIQEEITALLKRAQKNGDSDKVSYLLARQIQFQMGKITPLQYYKTVLLEATAPEQVPHLRQYVQNLQLHQQVDPFELDHLLTQMSEEIEDFLIQTEKEKELLLKLKINELTQKMLQLKISKDEWLYYKNNKKHFPKKELQKAARFYQLAEQRDKALLSNTLDLASKKPDYQVVLIAGGFHLEGLQVGLKERQQSYVTIAPLFNEQPNTALYFKRLTESQANRLAIPTPFLIQERQQERAFELAREQYAVMYALMIYRWVKSESRRFGGRLSSEGRKELVLAIESYFRELIREANREFTSLRLNWKNEIPESYQKEFLGWLRLAKSVLIPSDFDFKQIVFTLEVDGTNFAVVVSTQKEFPAKGISLGPIQVSINPVLGSGIIKTPVKKGGLLRRIGWNKGPQNEPLKLDQFLKALDKRDSAKKTIFEDSYIDVEDYLINRFPWLADAFSKNPREDEIGLIFRETEGEPRFAYMDPKNLEIVLDTALLENQELTRIELLEELFHFLMAYDRIENKAPLINEREADLVFEELLTDFEKTRYLYKRILSEDRDLFYQFLKQEGVDLFGFANVLSSSISLWKGIHTPIEVKELTSFVKNVFQYALQEPQEEGGNAPYSTSQRDVLRKEFEENKINSFLAYLFRWHNRYLIRADEFYSEEPPEGLSSVEIQFSKNILLTLLTYHFENEPLFPRSTLFGYLLNSVLKLEDLKSIIHHLTIDERVALFWNWERTHPDLYKEAEVFLKGLSFYQKLTVLKSLPEETIGFLDDKELKLVGPYLYKVRGSVDGILDYLHDQDDLVSIRAASVMLKHSPSLTVKQLSAPGARSGKRKLLELNDGLDVYFVVNPTTETLQYLLDDVLVEKLKEGAAQLVFLGDFIQGDLVTKAMDGRVYKNLNEVPKEVNTYLGLEVRDSQPGKTKLTYLDQPVFYTLLKLQILFPDQVFALMGMHETALFLDSKRHISPAAFKGIAEMNSKADAARKRGFLSAYLQQFPLALSIGEQGSPRFVAASRMSPDRSHFVILDREKSSFLLSVLRDVSGRVRQQVLEARKKLSANEKEALEKIKSDRHDPMWLDLNLVPNDQTDPFLANGFELSLLKQDDDAKVFLLEFVGEPESALEEASAIEPEADLESSSETGASTPDELDELFGDELPIAGGVPVSNQVGPNILEQLFAPGDKPFAVGDVVDELAKKHQRRLGTRRLARDLMFGKVAPEKKVPVGVGDSTADIAMADALKELDDQEDEMAYDIALSEMNDNLMKFDLSETLTWAEKAQGSLDPEDERYSLLNRLIVEIELYLEDSEKSESSFLKEWMKVQERFDVNAYDLLIQRKVEVKTIVALGDFLEWVNELKEEEKVPYLDVIKTIKGFLNTSLRTYLPEITKEIDRLMKLIPTIEEEEVFVETEKEYQLLREWLERYPRLAGLNVNDLTFQARYSVFLKKIDSSIQEKKIWFKWKAVKPKLKKGISFEEASKIRRIFYRFAPYRYSWFAAEEQWVTQVWLTLFEDMEQQYPEIEAHLINLKEKLEVKVEEAAGKPLVLWLIEENIFDAYERSMQEISQAFAQKAQPHSDPKDNSVKAEELEKKLVSLANEVDRLMLKALLGRFLGSLDSHFEQLVGGQSLTDHLADMSQMDKSFFDLEEIPYAQWESLADNLWTEIYENWGGNYEELVIQGKAPFNLVQLVQENAEFFLGVEADQVTEEKQAQVLKAIVREIFLMVTFTIDRELNRYGVQNQLLGFPRKSFEFATILKAFIYYTLIRNAQVHPPLDEGDEMFSQAYFSLPFILRQLSDRDRGYRYYRAILTHHLTSNELGSLAKKLSRPSDEERIQRVLAEVEEVQERYDAVTGDQVFTEKTFRTTDFFDFVWERSLIVTRYRNLIEKLQLEFSLEKIVDYRLELEALKGEYRRLANLHVVVVPTPDEAVDAFRSQLEKIYQEPNEGEQAYIEAMVLGFRSKGIPKEFPGERDDYFHLVLSEKTEGAWSFAASKLIEAFDQELSMETILEKVSALLEDLPNKGDLLTSTRRLSALKLKAELSDSESSSDDEGWGFNAAQVEDVFDRMDLDPQQDLQNRVSLFDVEMMTLLERISQLERIRDYHERLGSFDDLRREFEELVARAERAELSFQKEVLELYPSYKFEKKFNKKWDEWSAVFPEETFLEKRAELTALIEKAKKPGFSELGFFDQAEMDAYFLTFEQRMGEKYKERALRLTVSFMIDHFVNLAQARIDKDPNSRNSFNLLKKGVSDLNGVPEEAGWDWTELKLFIQELAKKFKTTEEPSLIKEMKLLLHEVFSENPTDMNKRLLMLAQEYVVETERNLIERIQTEVKPNLDEAIALYLNDSTQGPLLDKESLIEEQKRLLNYLLYTYEGAWEPRMEVTGEVSRIKKYQEKLEAGELLVPLDFFDMTHALDPYSGQLANELGQKGLFLQQYELLSEGLESFDGRPESVTPLFEFLINMIPKLVEKGFLNESYKNKVLKEIKQSYALFLSFQKALEVLGWSVVEGAKIPEDWATIDILRAKRLIQEITQRNNDQGIRSLIPEELSLIDRLSDVELDLNRGSFPTAVFSVPMVTLPEPTVDFNMEVMWLSTDLNLGEILEWAFVLAQHGLESKIPLSAVSERNRLRQNLLAQREVEVEAREVLFRLKYQLLYETPDFLDQLSLQLEWQKLLLLIHQFLPNQTFSFLESIRELVENPTLDHNMVYMAIKVAVQDVKNRLSRLDQEAWDQFRETGTNPYLQKVIELEQGIVAVEKQILPTQAWKDWIPEEKLNQFLNEVLEDLEVLVADPSEEQAVQLMLETALERFPSEELTPWNRLQDKFSQLMQSWTEDKEAVLSFVLQIDWDVYELKTGKLIPHALKLELEARLAQHYHGVLFSAPEKTIWVDPALGQFAEVFKEESNNLVRFFASLSVLSREVRGVEDSAIVWTTVSNWALIPQSLKQSVQFVVVSDTLSSSLVEMFLSKKWHYSEIRNLMFISFLENKDVYFLAGKEEEIGAPSLFFDFVSYSERSI